MARVTADSVMVRWDEVPGATGYVLLRSDSVDGTYTPVAETDARTVHATDAGVDTTAAHFYRVRAKDATGLSDPSAAAVSSLSAPPPTFPANGVLSLDFGPGALAEGATRVDATTAWSPTQRVGFVETSKVTASDRGTADPVRSDFVTVGDTELVVDLPNGDYTVSLVAGDPAGPTDIALTVEQMAKVQRTTRTAGQFLEMQFEIAVVDGQLNVEVTGATANLSSLVITKQAARTAGARPNVWVTGDSTVQSYTADFVPQAGWGQMLDRYLSDDVTVTNKAIGGRSSKNFISQGRLDEVLLDIRPGDYLFTQFGHNDNSYGVDDRFAAPADYREYLRTFVEGARQRGATPVVVTPVSRRDYAADGTVNVSFPAYVDAARSLAAETGTHLVDLSASSRAYLQEIGPEQAKSVFLWVPAGVYPNRPHGTQDDTHFQEYGAIQLARLVATDVQGLDDPLAAEVEQAEPPANVPGAPSGLVATNVSSSSAQLRWTGSEGADIYRVFGKLATEDDSAYVLRTTSTVPQAMVTGLTEGTSYDFRVVATNGRGDSEPSAAVRVTTPEPTHSFDMQPAGAPVETGFTEINPSSAYSEARGYGFTATGMGSRDRGAGFTPPPSNLLRDFLLPGTAHPFKVKVANGTYALRFYWGDMIGTAALTPTVEGRNYGRSTTGRGTLGSKIVQPVAVTDGFLDIVAEGWWNGLEITPLQLAPTDLTLDDLSISGSDVTVSLRWTGSGGAERYRVYRSLKDGSDRRAVGETTGTTLVDDTADLGQEYVYSVVAVDAAGTESIGSNDLPVTTVDPTVPTVPAPAGLAVGEVTKNTVQLSWEAVPGALFYQVYRAEPGKQLELVARTDGAAYTDTGVLTTVEYTYAVASVNAGGVSERSATVTSPAPTKLVRQAERLDRAPVAVRTRDGVYVGWRMLGLDPSSIGFNVYRDGELITPEPVTGSTNLVDPEGTAGSTYRVSTVLNDVEHYATDAFGVWDSQTLDVPLDKPAASYTKDGQPYGYRANDASVGDLDGDGDYEVVVKWDPTNSKDNSSAGYTGTVYLDAYQLDGTRLWRVDMGPNIRAGAHYTQFQVFDLDGDGDAEVTMKTGDGTVDGRGEVIGDSSADHRNSSGYVLTGPEYLTVFDGRTGGAVDTIPYVPPRGDVGSWGDTYGNRVDRFLAGVAYLDGEHPSVLFSRGYYTRTVVAAFDFDGRDLTQRWVFDTEEWGEQYRGQGNHQFATADVDGDQKDEIVFGAMTIDDDGEPLYNTGLRHGDALHVGDLDPSRRGLEVFGVHESPGGNGGVIASFRDARTGEVIWKVDGTRDTGRGAAADIDPTRPGAEAWNIGDGGAWNAPDGFVHSATGELLSNTIPAANFVTWWDGDLTREITDHDWDEATRTGVPTISKWDPATQTEREVYRATGTLTSNDTKGSPALQADLFGDWREELVTRTADSTALRIATSTDPTSHRLRTLQHDSQYREAVAWQNTGYNQPPHPSFFLGAGMEEPPAPSIAYTGEDPGPGELIDHTPPTVSAALGGTDRSVALVAYDAASGVDTIEYRLGRGDWTTYSSPVSLPAKAATLSFRATDRHGNVSGVHTLTVPASPTGVVPLAVTAAARCVDGAVTLTVSALNDADGPVGVTVETVHGSTERVVLEPGASSAPTFATGQASVPAGTATVTGVAKAGEQRSLSVYSVAYEGASCG
jgi:fibronectin type 3 domain-containing protein/lysophospholipase L1-like esterase